MLPAECASVPAVAPAANSAPLPSTNPPITGSPSGRPSRPAASAVSVPWISPASRISGSLPIGTPAAAHSSSDQPPVVTSISPVNPALLGSINRAPVSCARTAVGRWPSVTAARITSARCSANQAAVVELIPPGVGRLPASARCRARPTSRSIRRPCATLRRSLCSTNRVSGRPPRSSGAQAGPIPVIPSASTPRKSSCGRQRPRMANGSRSASPPWLSADASSRTTGPTIPPPSSTASLVLLDPKSTASIRGMPGYSSRASEATRGRRDAVADSSTRGYRIRDGVAACGRASPGAGTSLASGGVRMIVDCHTHVWERVDQLGRAAEGGLPPRLPGVRPKPVPAADPDEHYARLGDVDKTIVLGFQSRYLEADVPNDLVAGYVERDPKRLIGFAGIDPTAESAVDDLRVARHDLKLLGLTVSPAGQDFHPADTDAMDVYAEAEKLGMPILFHPGGPMAGRGKLAYGRPHLLDEVARSFPDLRIVVAQLGRPWVDEAVALLSKHPHVYADVSALVGRPWMAYNALVQVYEAGVIGKLLFGSDFPFHDPADAIGGLYSLNQMVQGTHMPVVPREELRGIIERDALALLGLNG